VQVIVDVPTAARRLVAQGVVAYPTETVYGLGVDPESPRALESLYALKGRERAQPVAVLVRGLDDLEALTELPERARALAQHYWPGPLTLVVPPRKGVLEPLRDERGVGFRCSPHPTAAALVAACGRPIVSTSCNPSGASPCRDPDEVRAVFGDELWVVGGEPAGGRAASTVVTIDARGQIELLREGELSLANLEDPKKA